MTNPYGEPPATVPPGPVPAPDAPSVGPWPESGPPEQWLPPEVPEDPRRKGTLVSSAIVALVVAGGGLGIGGLWVLLAPRVAVVKVAQGFVYADAEPEEAIAGDTWFLVLGVAAGLVFTVLAWVVLRRYRGVAMLVALVVGSLVGAWLAWYVGIRIGLAQFEAVRDTVAVGTRVDAPLVLRLTELDRHHLWPPKATGVVAAQALTAAIVYTMLAGFSIHPNLRPVEDPTLR